MPWGRAMWALSVRNTQPWWSQRRRQEIGYE